MLSIIDLQSGYGKKHVLHGISMHVGRGEVVCLLGRNGMGKTTLLRTVMGINPTWAGRVEFLGSDVTNASPHTVSRLGLGYVPEGRGIFPNLTVYENPPWSLDARARVQAFSAPQGAILQLGQSAFRRRAADARDRPGAVAQSVDDHAG
jgi:ABC-type branched-subunit amino acid transport system ATPase component